MAILPYLRRKVLEELKTPSVYVSDTALVQLLNILPEKKIEIMLLGKVTKTETERMDIYTIDEFVIPPQTDNTGAFVTTHDVEYPKWLYEMTREERLSLKCHLHTHPSMAVSPSSTDDNMIRDKVENIDDFYLRLIGSNDLKIRVDLFDVEHSVLYEELPLQGQLGIDENIIYYTFTPKGMTVSAHRNEILLQDLDNKIIPVKKVVTDSKKGKTTAKTTSKNGGKKSGGFSGSRGSSDKELDKFRDKDLEKLFKFYDPKTQNASIFSIQVTNHELGQPNWDEEDEFDIYGYINARYGVDCTEGDYTQDLKDALQLEIECIMYESSPTDTLIDVEEYFIDYLQDIAEEADLSIPTTLYERRILTVKEWYLAEFK